ncbi:hypothetical protein N665_1127s0003 [Sinapis alba]|nr:hypothetical protein N665_1127s0003 [Sinapis alba]
MVNPDDFPDFPSREDFFKDNIAHSPKILSQAIDSSGPSKLSQAEKVLNWQTENSLVQNRLLSTINHKVDQLAEGYNKTLHSLQSSITEIHGRLNNLHQEMMSMARHMMVDTTQFRNKEAETASLKNQLKDLQRCLESMIHNQRQTDAYFNPFGSTSAGMPMYQESYSPGFLSGYQAQKSRTPLPGFLSSDEVFTSRYGSTLISYPKTKPARPKSRRQKESEFEVNPTKRPTLTSSSSHESIEDKKKKEKYIRFIEFSMASLLDTLGKSTEQSSQSPTARDDPQPSRPIANINYLSDTSFNDCKTDLDEESLPRQFAIGNGSNTPKEEPSINEVYSSDEEMNYAPPRQEMPNKHFASKVMVFTFDDIPFDKWNDCLDEFHAWMNSEAITSPLHLVIQQFTERLSGAFKEWWNSLGEYRQQQVYQTTIPLFLGEIHREFIGTPTHQKEKTQEEYFSAKCCSLRKSDLEKYFEGQTRRNFNRTNPAIRLQEFWMEFMDRSKQLSKICARPDLSIKCSKSKKSCSCGTHDRRRRFKKRFTKHPTRFRHKKFFQKKQSFKKSTKCFLCQKEGHFAKNCPNRSAKKKQYLINSISEIAPDIDLDSHDLESVLSYDSDDNNAICGYSEYDSSSVSSPDEDDECCFKITKLPRHEEIITPHFTSDYL